MALVRRKPYSRVLSVTLGRHLSMRCRTQARRLRSNVHAKPSLRWARFIRSGDGASSPFVRLLCTRGSLWKCRPCGNPPRTRIPTRGLESSAFHIPTANPISIFFASRQHQASRAWHYYRAMFAPARKCCNSESMSTTRCCGCRRPSAPTFVTVCSTPSRRVAALRPRYAGLAALTASPRTHTNPALNRRPLESTPKMLWSAKCSESFILKRLLTARSTGCIRTLKGCRNQTGSHASPSRRCASNERRGTRHGRQEWQEATIEGYLAKSGKPVAKGRSITWSDGRKAYIGSPGTGAPDAPQDHP